MSFKPSIIVITSALLVGASLAAIIGWRFAIFVLPFSWTREPAQLAELLRVTAGATIADIGAGDGALAVEMAQVVGHDGVVYATELSAEQRAAIAQRVVEANTPQIRIVKAGSAATHLPADCCEAVYLRAVFHHVADRGAFAREVRKAVRPGGRVAIIDFPPGALWFHGNDHGITPEHVQRAFEEAGLSVVRHLEEWGGGMFLLLFERPAN